MRARLCRRALVGMSLSDPDECALFGDGDADISSSSSLCITCPLPLLRRLLTGTASLSELLVPLSPRCLSCPLTPLRAGSSSSASPSSSSLVLLSSSASASSPASPSSVPDARPASCSWRVLSPRCVWQKTPSSCARQFLQSSPFCVRAGHAVDCAPPLG